MVLAVYMPEQLPQVGQQESSYWCSSSSLILPAEWAPTASKMFERPMRSLPGSLPGSIGPPLTKTVGKSMRAAAISMPGTTLSQLGTKTTPSKAWAMSMISQLSAI